MKKIQAISFSPALQWTIARFTASPVALRLSTLRPSHLSSLLLAALLCTGSQTHAQKAYPIDLLGLAGKIAVPQSTQGCYAGSTTKTDPSNGAVSIVNLDPTYKEIYDQLDKITKAAMDQAHSQMPARGQTPSTDQVQQMQQQAMQKASSMQGMSPQQMAAAQQAKSQSGAPSTAEMAVLQKMGKAQSAAGHISQTISEMSQKFNKLDKSKIDNVPMGANCPEVQQGGYAGPTCDCLVKKEVAYETARDANYNAYLQQVEGLIQEFLGKLKPDLTVVDDFEQTAKYGDALSNPVYKQLVVSVQRQALAGVVTALSTASGNWEDAAKMYVQLVNGRNGATVGCGGHKK